jgi:Bacterial PH domain
MWRQSRLQVVVHDTGLHVVNYLSTFRVPWDSIERFDSFFGYWGIRVMMKDGRIVTLNATQKQTIAVWLHRLTRADKIANELNERLAR